MLLSYHQATRSIQKYQSVQINTFIKLADAKKYIYCIYYILDAHFFLPILLQLFVIIRIDPGITTHNQSP